MDSNARLDLILRRSDLARLFPERLRRLVPPSSSKESNNAAHQPAKNPTT
jgi:hypothetical protein